MELGIVMIATMVIRRILKLRFDEVFFYALTIGWLVLLISRINDFNLSYHILCDLKDQFAIADFPGSSTYHLVKDRDPGFLFEVVGIQVVLNIVAGLIVLWPVFRKHGWKTPVAIITAGLVAYPAFVVLLYLALWIRELLVGPMW